MVVCVALGASEVPLQPEKSSTPAYLKMSDEELLNGEPDPQMEGHVAKVSKVSGMYREYFLDYASYVILERAVPAMYDGLKPVQRRILHSMYEMHDGRYHKVANIIGNTMKYHPHGDASIGDALVQLGQKDLLIDCQGNWGNILTGDSAAAPRYIEARLTKFALDVVFSPKITQWQSSYDGRAKEPVFFPVKFPLLLAQGVEGIAVGLSTKILPHNFNELIDGCIRILNGQNVTIYPDFPTGGIADVSNYNDGQRGGRVRVRAKINAIDKKTLVISEIPFGTTTGSLIDSILKANDKGKIKIRKIEDNTAENVEIVIHLPPGLSPDKTIDALYAFTDCEVSISPIACVIYQDKPLFMGVSEMLRESAFLTRELLKAELNVKLNELREAWHFASLEKIFIEHKIYRLIEDAETWEQVISSIRIGLKPHIGHLLRPVTEEDIVRLTEIKIKRISKYDSDKANDHIQALEGQIAEVEQNLANLTDYTIRWFEYLKEKYGKGRERKTELRLFDEIQAQTVAIANEKLYINRQEGFIGTSLKKDEYICDCSDIDDIIVFRRDGKMMVVKVDQKVFVGPDIIHAAVFKKGDRRTIYNLIYRDGSKGPSYMKRFYVDSIIRGNEYDITQGKPGSEILHLTANPNGEAEVVSVYLKPISKLKKLRFDIDFATLAIKGRNARGNLVTKYPIKKIELKEKGLSTLAPRKIWLDTSIMRLNTEGRGQLLGTFKGDDLIIQVTKTGTYRLTTTDLSTHFDDDALHIRKFNPQEIITCVYWDHTRKRYFVKRFHPEKSDRRESFIPEGHGNQPELITFQPNPVVLLEFDEVKGKARPPEEVNLAEFISVKGMKTIGNQLTTHPVRQITLLHPHEPAPEETTPADFTDIDIDLSTEEARQITLFDLLDQNPEKDNPNQ
jgi:topoisomerase-4 subunit A